jgi:hypothetical protein
MNKAQTYIAILAVLGIVGVVFFTDTFKNLPASPTTNHATSTLDLPTPNISIPTLANAAIEAQAWGNFQDYLKAAKNHDLASLKKFSYKLSTACSDPAQEAECFRLMDSVSLIGAEFKQTDFKNVAYDASQVVMSTDITIIPEINTPIRLALFFVRGEDGSPKLLAIKFCLGDERNAKEGETCANTDPATRDKNANGWWDDLEAQFR